MPPVSTSSGSGGLLYSLKNAAFVPEEGFLYGLNGTTPLAVTLPTGEEGDEIGFQDAKGSSPSAATGFGLCPFTINPPSSGTIQNRAQSITLGENETLILRCRAPGHWLTSGGLVQPASLADNLMLSLVRAICPVGEVKRMYAPVSGAGFVLSSVANLGITAYWLSLDTGFTIGSPSSGANIAQPWAQQLFEHLWNSDSNLALRTKAGATASRGATSTADWNANKRLVLPDARGRSLIGVGQGSGMSSRALGSTGGAETHALTASENAAHSHGYTDPGHFHNSAWRFNGVGVTGGSIPVNNADGAGPNSYGFSSTVSTTGISINSSGSGAAHNNMPPFLAIQTLIFGGFA